MGKFSNGKEITENLLASCCREISSEITPNIYLGNENVAKNKKHLLEKGITHIIRIGDKLIDHYKNDFTYLSITIKDVDEEQIYGYFNVAYNFMGGGWGQPAKGVLPPIEKVRKLKYTLQKNSIGEGFGSVLPLASKWG